MGSHWSVLVPPLNVNLERQHQAGSPSGVPIWGSRSHQLAVSSF